MKERRKILRLRAGLSEKDKHKVPCCRLVLDWAPVISTKNNLFMWHLIFLSMSGFYGIFRIMIN